MNDTVFPIVGGMADFRWFTWDGSYPSRASEEDHVISAGFTIETRGIDESYTRLRGISSLVH